MSREVDERVVEMRLNNSQFMEAAKMTLSTLAKLTAGIDFSKANKSVDQVSNSMQGIDFTALTNNIQALTDHFTGFGIIGDQIMRRVGDAVANMGAKVMQTVNSLTFEQVGNGFHKFEDLTRNTAILVAQGYDLATVEGQLEKLNWFTDETSYNFTDMVANIGKFTASGQKLDESVDAMQGIATWAALSGQNASTASRAMYQLSQAMGAGVMRKEDYRSIQNASMDTMEFRQKALDAGVALGTLRKNADGTYTSIAEGFKSSTFEIGQFANNLTEEGWFNKDVMMKVFQDYSAAVDQLYEYASERGITASEAIEQLNGQVDEFGLKAFKAAQEARSWTDVIDSLKDAVSTGWMNTFKIIFGNYEEATELYTNLANSLYDVFMTGTEERNELLSAWKEAGGRDDFVNSIYRLVETIQLAIDTIRESFAEIFPPITAENLVNFTKKVSDFFDTITGHKYDDSVKSIENLRSLLASGFDITKISGVNVEAAEYLIKFSNIMENISKVFQGFFALFAIAGKAISEFLGFLSPAFKMIPGLGDNLLETLANIADKIIEFNERIQKEGLFSETLGKISEKLGPIAAVIQEAMTKIIDAIKGFFEGETLADRFSKVAKGFGKVIDFFIGLFTRFSEFASQIYGVFKSVFGVVAEVVTETLSRISDATGKLDLHSILDLFTLLMGAGVMKNVKGFTSVLGEIGDAVKSASNLINQEATKTLAESILMISGALFVLSLIDQERMFTSVAALAVVFKLLESSLKSLGKISSSAGEATGKIAEMVGSMKQSLQTLALGKAMVSFALAVLVLAAALKVVASIDQEQLVSGLIGVSLLLIELTVATKYLAKYSKDSPRIAKGLVGVAVALLVLTASVKRLGEMDSGQMIQGIIAVGAILAELMMFSRWSKQIGMFNGIGFIAIATSLLIICSVVKKLGEMDFNTISQGIISMGVILLALAGFVGVMDFAKHAVATSVAMIVMSTAMVILAGALKIIATMTVGDLAKSLIAMGVALAEFAVAALVMQKAIGGALAMTVMAGALMLMVPPLMLLGKMSLWSIIKALIALGGTLAIFGVAATILGPMIPVMLGLGAAIALLGVGMLALGAGIAALSGSLVAVGASIVEIVKVIVLGIAGILEGIVDAIISLIPKIAQAVGVLLVAIVQALAEYLPILISSLMTILFTIMQAIQIYLPAFIDAGTKLAIGFINGIATSIMNNTDTLMVALNNLGISIMYAIAAILESAISSIPGADALFGPKISEWKESLANSFQDISEVGSGIGIDIPAGIDVEPMKGKMSELASAGVSAFGSSSTDFQGAGQDALGNLITGIDLSSDDLTTNMSILANHSAESFNDASAQPFYDNGAYIPAGIANGVAENSQPAIDSVVVLAQQMSDAYAANLSINSPSKVFEQLASYIPAGVVRGIERNTNLVVDASEHMAEETVSPFDAIMSDIASLISRDMDLEPVIRPTLDLSGVTSEAGRIGSLLDGNRVSAMLGGANSLALAGGLSNNISINVYGAPGQDVNELADIVMYKMNNRLELENSRWK